MLGCTSICQYCGRGTGQNICPKRTITIPYVYTNRTKDMCGITLFGHKLINIAIMFNLIKILFYTEEH